MSTPGDGVRVRMYRQGLGDCFLLSFTYDGGTRHVLVDCGVVGRRDGAEQMAKVARDVEKATDGRLDVVVATHAHWDHVSGFADAAEVFAAMEIGEVWLPSTENPGNESGRATRARRRELVARLRKVASSDAARTALGEGGTSVLNLFGACAAEGGDAGAHASRDDEEAALAFLRDPSRRVRYLDTRDAPLGLPGLAAVKAYVLGPRPLTSRPAAAAAQGAMDLSGSFFTAAEKVLALGEDPAWKEVLERNQPFDPSHRLAVVPTDTVPSAPAKAAEFFQSRYYGPGQKWRRIDTDWLGVARGLALTLESHTNDGSLVLAFELPGSGKVLLFPGDARVAPPAWNELRWAGTGGSAAPATPTDLLRRTVLYKVPHHCSQWATPAPALAAMESPELVALVSTDAAVAASLGWRFPHPPLVEELRRKTRGRLLISTGADPVVPDDPPGYGAAPTEWQAFRDAVRQTPLYVEYSLPG
ncbi:MAG TPA: MBL fold metallo-hydrolase [Longimicrobium sp.]|nr:MBL fold metallo-hydrolase [Longimicrobium sp.]